MTWNRGQNIITEKFEDFVPAPETPEYAAPKLNEIEWQWRQETTVRAAMIEAEEANWAFLLTLEDAEFLGPRAVRYRRHRRNRPVPHRYHLGPLAED